MSESRSHRVFFALWPDHETIAHLSALANELTSRGGGRVMQPGALHLTLAFVGSVTSSQIGELERLAAGISGEAFDLTLDRLGFWPQRGILWAGCREAPAALRRLADPLAAALNAAGFVIAHGSASALVPHITLARRARCKSLPRLGTPLRWRVSEFDLVESRLGSSGSSYQTLTSFPLDEPGDAG